MDVWCILREDEIETIYYIELPEISNETYLFPQQILLLIHRKTHEELSDDLCRLELV